MIQEFIDRWEAGGREKVQARFSEKHPECYRDIVKAVVEAIADSDAYRNPDPERIHGIDDGDYQGTLVFVIGESGYQPSTYWAVTVSYGSCSGCDTLEGIRSYDDDKPSEEQTKDYVTLALHILQGLKKI
jgi:hypothetical protein